MTMTHPNEVSTKCHLALRTSDGEVVNLSQKNSVTDVTILPKQGVRSNPVRWQVALALITLKKCCAWTAPELMKSWILTLSTFYLWVLSAFCPRVSSSTVLSFFKLCGHWALPLRCQICRSSCWQCWSSVPECSGSSSRFSSSTQTRVCWYHQIPITP